MKQLGTVLMWLGFLSGSLATVFSLPSAGVEYVKNYEAVEDQRFELKDLSEVVVPEDNWNLIPWTWFGISAAVCTFGVVLIRTSLSAAADQGVEQSTADLDAIGRNLENLIANMEKLRKQIDTMAPSRITEYIDEHLADDFRMFADGRECMVTKFGLNTYADVMSNFAAGERYANRAWSASADGYVDEAKDCVERSTEYLTDAAAELNRAKKNGSA